MPAIHTLILGKTGMGKSTLLRAMAADAMSRGDGLLLLDPHGDLAAETANAVPRHRRNDLVFLDPRDPARCPGVNPFRNVPPTSRSVVVSGVLATLKKLWPDGGVGPRSEHLLRYAMLAICEVRGATFLDARNVLSSERHRAWALKQVKDEDVLRFWVDEYVSYGKQLQAQASAPPLNKIGAIVGNANVRAVLSKPRPLRAEVCMARSRIVLARLSKGQLGSDGAFLLGGLLLGLFQQATMAREALTQDARAPFAMFVDEVGSFAAAPFIELLAEARKYGVSLTLATQSISVMEPELRAGILSNVNRLVCFRVAAEDARLISLETAGRFGPAALMQLDVGERVVKDGGKPALLIPPWMTG